MRSSSPSLASTTRTFSIVTSPVFLTAMVYGIVPPMTTVAGPVLVIWRPGLAPSSTVQVSWTSPACAWLAVAVFTMGPGRSASVTGP